ncbi:cupin domain-containing protein [Skermanella mucosa]|uniref:cupin domain-containing protein n=1 Tax=Skermanella mucosa TaxID=1789672 RepID=UPI001E493CBF|nr:cupin domain-containing protein [Skermanella mucosa]UEM23416.1 cupin domain-containing protein [Skermanella mucosa]
MITRLLAMPSVRVERIVSHGQVSPPGFWYDQDEGEWVLVLAGSAVLEVEGEAVAIPMGPGDCIDIPPRRRHRIAWTDPDQPTVWLAVFYAV